MQRVVPAPAGARPIAVITRTLEYHPADGSPEQPITVTIGPIEPDPKHDLTWLAWLKVEGFPETYNHALPGADSMQAVTIAMKLAPTMARAMMPDGGRLTFCGEESEDLGFPPFPPRSLLSRVRRVFGAPAA